MRPSDMTCVLRSKLTFLSAGLVSGQFLIYGVIKDGQYKQHSLSGNVLADGLLSALGAPPGIEIHKETQVD